MEHVYFPHTGMVSLLAVLKDGKAIETATVGRRGCGRHGGLDCILRLPAPSCRWLGGSLIGQLPLEKVVQESSALKVSIVKYNAVLLARADNCRLQRVASYRVATGALDSADAGSYRHRQGPAHARVSVGNAWRPPHLGQRNRAQTSDGRPHSLQPRRDPHRGSVRSRT